MIFLAAFFFVPEIYFGGHCLIVIYITLNVIVMTELVGGIQDYLTQPSSPQNKFIRIKYKIKPIVSEELIVHGELVCYRK